jgi:beta-glucosidase
MSRPIHYAIWRTTSSIASIDRSGIALMEIRQTLRTLFSSVDIESFAAHWQCNLDEDTITREVELLLAKMTLQEKIAQMSGDGGDLVLLKLGIYVLGLKRFPNMYSGYNERLGIPPLSFTDGPRGIVIGNATCFPAAMTRGASFDPALEQRVGEAIGREARASGANYFAGLCVNLLRHPAWGRAQETYGEDSFHLGAMGVALMRGVQSQHVMVCAKHFAVNSIENSRFYLDVQIDEETLHEIYLPHFKTLVDAGLDSLMSAYNQLNGEYCGHSHTLLHEILREQWGFNGFVSSDWLWGIYETIKPANAGMDIEMPRGNFYARKLQKAVQRGDVPLEKIDATVRRILTAKLRWLIHLPDKKIDKKIIACRQHRELARESAEQSMVLLQNNGILPWHEKNLSGKTIAVIGELAAMPCLGDHGSSRVSPPEIATFLDGLRQRAAADIRIVYHDGKDMAQAADIAHRADIVLLAAGYHAEDEGENLTSNRKPVAKPKVQRGGDRASLYLLEKQQQLIAAVCGANKNTVVALVAGSAVMMNQWQDKPAAILFTGYPGMEGGHALARILFGDVNPSGKLPFTIPASEEQLPAFDRWAAVARYDYFHGYALCDHLQQAPAFSFGFGLSYTTFFISTPQLNQQHYKPDDTVCITVSIRNTGTCDGAEVVQCYIGQLNPVIQPAPVKRLCAFEKVWLAAGEEKSITLRIPVQQLARYDGQTKQWQCYSGEYHVWAGSVLEGNSKTQNPACGRGFGTAQFQLFT